MNKSSLFRELKSTYDRNVFVMLRYRDGTRFRAIENAIREHLNKHELVPRLAKDAFGRETLWENVQLYMNTCNYGIATFESISESSFSPSVCMELGYLKGQGKKCLILKQHRTPPLYADMLATLYREFNITNIKETIGEAIDRWAVDDLQLNTALIRARKVVCLINTDSSYGGRFRKRLLWLLYAGRENSEWRTYTELKAAITVPDDEHTGPVKYLASLEAAEIIESRPRTGDHPAYRLTGAGRIACTELLHR